LPRSGLLFREADGDCLAFAFELQCPGHPLVIRACARGLRVFHYPPINPQSGPPFQLHGYGLSLHQHDEIAHDEVFALGGVLAHVERQDAGGVVAATPSSPFPWFAIPHGGRAPAPQLHFLADELGEFLRADFAQALEPRDFPSGNALKALRNLARGGAMAASTYPGNVSHKLFLSRVLRSREREKVAAGRMRVVGQKTSFASRGLGRGGEMETDEEVKRETL
jgi:hypothetical protein